MSWWVILVWILLTPETTQLQHPLVTKFSEQKPNITHCAPLKNRKVPPKSVHDLNVHDIKVIAGLGDSITAAFAARGLPEKGLPISMDNTYEYRGLSFALGLDPDAYSLASYMSHYRPDLIGGSRGNHSAEFCYVSTCLPFQYHPAQDQLNAAQSGATVMNLKHELNYLFKQMKKTQGIDFEKDFKLINLFIGNNDVCLGCSHLSQLWLSADEFEKEIRGVLDSIQTNIPRVIVNIMLQPNISQVWDLTHRDPWCITLRASGLVFECSCAFLPGPFGQIARDNMDRLTLEYNQRILSIVKSLPKSHDFAVIVDPFMMGVSIRDWTLELLSDVDCFHPSLIAHQAMSVALWNNLFLSFKDKVKFLNPSTPIDLYCPTDRDRIRTS